MNIVVPTIAIRIEESKLARSGGFATCSDIVSVLQMRGHAKSDVALRVARILERPEERRVYSPGLAAKVAPA